MVVGMFLWLVNTYVPMAESIKVILNVVVVVATLVLVLQTFGLWDRVVGMWNKALASITKPRPAADLDKAPPKAS
jgi:hypothetical protein